ncbi:hypothetical protein MRX96_045699, partial [Rhipicephalus microplus]
IELCLTCNILCQCLQQHQLFDSLNRHIILVFRTYHCEHSTSPGTSALHDPEHGDLDAKETMLAILTSLCLLTFVVLVVSFVITSSSPVRADSDVDYTEDLAQLIVAPVVVKEAEVKLIVCTVSETATSEDMYPEAEYCDYLFYTDVITFNGHIEAKKDPVSWEVFQKRGPKYRLVQLGISFHLQNVTPNGLDDASNDLNALRREGIRHYGLLNVLSYQRDFQKTVMSTKGVLKRMKEMQREETAKIVLAIGSYGYANIYRINLRHGFREAVNDLSANMVVLITSVGWIGPQGTCIAAPPNPVITPNQRYFSLEYAWFAVKQGSTYNKPLIITGLSFEIFVSQRMSLGAPWQYLGSPMFTYGIISNSSKVLTMGELNDTLALKFAYATRTFGELRARTAWLLYNVHNVGIGNQCGDRPFDVIRQFCYSLRGASDESNYGNGYNSKYRDYDYSKLDNAEYDSSDHSCGYLNDFNYKNHDYHCNDPDCTGYNNLDYTEHNGTKLIICTVSETATSEDMYPDTEYCDYVFYTNVITSNGHIQAQKDPVSWDVFQRRGPKYRRVQLGISFDFQNVTPNGLDDASSDFDALRREGMRHYRLLTVLSFQKNFRESVWSTKDVLENGHPVTSRSAEHKTGLQVLKPRSPATTTCRTPNYCDIAAEHERVDEHTTLPEPEPLMDAGKNGSKSSHDGTDTEQAASSSPETSAAETSRESWVVLLSEGKEQKVPDHENGEKLAELLVDEAHFPPLDVGNAPPRDTGITPRVGSDHARTPNSLQPVVNPSPADTTLPAGPANEADKGFPTNPTQPARGRSDHSRSRSPRA